MREEDNVIIYFRSQTTKGIWIAKCSDIEPFTIVMDFEGTDSNQRGEVTLRAFYYFSVALLIERGFMVILYSFQLLWHTNLSHFQNFVESRWLLNGFNIFGCITLWFQSASVMLNIFFVSLALLVIWNVYIFQDDAAFERQSTLFALEIADVVLINMWVLFVHHYNIWMSFLPGKFDKCPQQGMILSSRKIKNSWCSLP